MRSKQMLAPLHFAIAVFAAAALLLASCTPAATVPVVASAVPVTGNNNAPAADQSTATQAAGSSIPETVTPAVKVSDQAVSSGTITVESVTSPGPGWIVIHVNSGGSPGEIIGWSPVKPGVNSNVAVTIDPSKATPVLYAMLHTDAGTVGTYEFPGPDKPVVFNGQMVSPAFAVTGGSGAAASASASPTAAAQQAAAPTVTQAAAAQPAVTDTSAPNSGTTSGGSSYGSPAATDTSAPSGGAASSGPATVSVADNTKLGKILVDSKGMTLYIFKKDTPGQSNCTGGCLENWPPLLVSSGSPTAGTGVTGKLGQITRSDNGAQVTYKDLPLYYFAGDKVPGDVNGQGIGNAWFAATP